IVARSRSNIAAPETRTLPRGDLPPSLSHFAYAVSRSSFRLSCGNVRVAMFGSGSTNHIAGPGTYILASWLFLRVLGFIYLVAFFSLAIQVKGLIGKRGIMPAVEFLHGRKHWG